MTGRDWGEALPEVPALGDVQPWRLAVVLDVNGDTARDRPAAPPRAASGAVGSRARDRLRHQ